jgi:hypothetical protein
MTIIQSLEDIQSMPPSSLSQTPLFQHILTSLPSLRGQIKDAVTASTKQWLLEIRNLTGDVGKLALDAIESERDVGDPAERRTPCYDSAGLVVP